MIRMMDMSTGRMVEDEFGAFETEVLNAEWTPAWAAPQAAPGLQEIPVGKADSEFDADRFLANVYRFQG